MPSWNRVVIIGVGLLGGSVGLALRKRKLARHIVGVGRNAQSLQLAMGRGAIDQAYSSIEEAAVDADLIIACTPVSRIADDLIRAGKVAPSHALLTDVGSTKASIVEAIDAAGHRCGFVGSHPLAGSEKSGPENASAELFAGKVCVVTPTAATSSDFLKKAIEFWQDLGSSVVQLSPQAHDDSVALTSHLPHLVASAMAGATPESILPLVASGWRDSTRIAAGDPSLWVEILGENRLPVLRALENFATVLQQWQRALESSDTTQLEILLKAGKTIRDQAVGS